MSTATEIVTAATSAPAEPRNSGLVLLSLIRPVAVLVVRKRVCALWQLGGRAAFGSARTTSPRAWPRWFATSSHANFKDEVARRDSSRAHVYSQLSMARRCWT